ncbi:acyl-CoA thioesterase [Mycobacterium sp. NPDC003323]
MSPRDDAPFALSVVPRYAEVDQQAVVFHGHYLTWFDEAWTAYLDHRSLSYPELIAAGIDFQVVRSEIDYRASVRWRDTVRVTAVCEAVGTTSFTVAFAVLRTGDDGVEQVAVTGRNVYVVVSTDDWTKRPVPDALRRIFATANRS